LARGSLLTSLIRKTPTVRLTFNCNMKFLKRKVSSTKLLFELPCHATSLYAGYIKIGDLIIPQEWSGLSQDEIIKKLSPFGHVVGYGLSVGY
jgi:hypothetical protein